MIRAAKLAGFAAAAVFVAALPAFVNDFRAFRLASVGVFFIALLGLNIVTGYSGQISLGHGAFMAVGGYTTAILMADHGVQDVLTIPLAGLAAGVAGLAFGLPATRLSGLYLALATFGIAIAVPSVILKADRFTEGTTGLNLFGIETQTGLGIEVKLLGRTLTNNDWLYYLTWTCAGVLFLLGWALLSGRFGRVARATRDSEIAAAAFGINPTWTKTLAFGISAFYAGVAGALFALEPAFVDPGTFPVALSITLLVGAAVGGLNSLLGPAFGAVFIVYMPIYAAKISKSAPTVVYGVALILFMLLLPAGVGGLIGRLWERLELRRRERQLSA